MKNALLSILVLLISGSLFGQAEFSFELRTTNSISGVPGETLIIIGDFENNSGETIDILITREENNIPADWNTSLCVDICLPPPIDATVLSLLDGDDQTYSMWFYTTEDNPNNGSALISMINQGNPDNRYDIEYFASTVTTSVETPNELANQVSINPNPFSGKGMFQVSPTLLNTYEELILTVYDATGRLVLAKTVNGEQTTINMENEAIGTYAYVLNTGKDRLTSGIFILNQ